MPRSGEHTTKSAPLIRSGSDESFSVVKRELGYPNSKASLRSWVREIEQYGDLHMEQRRTPKYSESQRKIAVEYYLSHGKNVLRTCKKLGYPSHTIK